MTREEANEILEDWNLCHYTPSREAAETVISALDPLEIISALRPVSREQVEKVWRGKWIKELRQTYIPVEYDEQGEVILHDFVVYHCSICGRENTKEEPICNCGAPLTDEAVEMVMERLEALHETD